MQMLRAEVGSERSCLSSFTSERESIGLGFVQRLAVLSWANYFGPVSIQNLCFSLTLTFLMAPLFSEIYIKGVSLLDLGLISVELLAAKREFPSPYVSGQVGASLVQSHLQCTLLFPAAEPAGLPWAGGRGNHHVPAAGRGICVCSTSQPAQGTGAEQKGLSPLPSPGEGLSPAGMLSAIEQGQCKASCPFWVLDVPYKAV